MIFFMYLAFMSNTSPDSVKSLLVYRVVHNNYVKISMTQGKKKGGTPNCKYS